MSIKLFVTDLDGTLLPTGQIVSPKNIKAVQDMVKAGITVTIATGRMYQSALPIAKSLGVDVPIITYNGALIKSVSGEIFYTNYIDSKLVIDIINFCKERNWYLQTYRDDILYLSEYNDYARGYENAVKVSGNEVGWNGLLEIVDEVPKLLTVTSGNEESLERIKIIKDNFGDKISAFQSNADYVEITSPNVSKAAAISILAHKLKIDISEVMAIGDSYNDLPMLKAAGKSIAMGNAVDEVKTFCNFITGNCIDDGFAEAVYKYVLN